MTNAQLEIAIPVLKTCLLRAIEQEKEYRGKGEFFEFMEQWYKGQVSAYEVALQLLGVEFDMTIPVNEKRTPLVNEPQPINAL